MYCIVRLDLDKWINDPPSESSEEEEEMETIFDTPNEHKYDHTNQYLVPVLVRAYEDLVSWKNI